MNNTTYSDRLQKTLSEIHQNNYSSLNSIRTQNRDLYERLLTDLYNFINHVAYNTISNRNKLLSYTQKYGLTWEANDDILIKYGDLKHEFFVKILSHIGKGNNKGKIWFDLLLEKEHNCWLPLLQLSANNMLTDKLKANNIAISLDEQLNHFDDEFSLRDIVTKKSPHHAEYSCESNAISHVLSESIVNLLLSDPLELIIYSEMYQTGEDIKPSKLYDEMKLIGDPLALLNTSLQTLSSAYYSRIDFTRIDLSSSTRTIRELLQMPREKAAKTLKKSLMNARRKMQLYFRPDVLMTIN